MSGTGLPLSGVASFCVSKLGSQVFGIATGITVVLHVLESLYTLSLCRKYSTGFVLGVSSLEFIPPT